MGRTEVVVVSDEQISDEDVLLAWLREEESGYRAAAEVEGGADDGEQDRADCIQCKRWLVSLGGYRFVSSPAGHPLPDGPGRGSVGAVTWGDQGKSVGSRGVRSSSRARSIQCAGGGGGSVDHAPPIACTPRRRGDGVVPRSSWRTRGARRAQRLGIECQHGMRTTNPNAICWLTLE